MSSMNVHKDNLGSQFSIFDMGSFVWARPHPDDVPKRVDIDALKQPARTILHGFLHDRNKVTRESRENELHEREQSQPWVTI